MIAAAWWQPLTEGRDDELDADKRQRATLLLQETAAIESRQSAWYQLNLWNSTLYNNRELIGFRWGATVNDQRELWPSNLRTENLIENIGQTMLAKAASSPLKPTLVPHGASWKTARAVRLADRFLYGVWSQTKAEDACLAMFNDAYTTGLGCIQVDYDTKEQCVKVESVFFDNIVIDNRECGNRAAPKTYRVRKAVHRDTVEAMYGVKLKLKDRPRYEVKRPCGDDWAIVVQAWRLPDADGTGGYTMTAVDDIVVHEAPWKKKYVPLVFLHWGDRQSGFFTKGGVEQVVSYQIMQNELNDAIKESQDAACKARMLVPAATHLDFSQWDTAGGRFITYSGMKPEPLVWETSLSELYLERERNKAAAYSHMGLSEMFAMGDMPQNVRMDSSAGLREARNMEDARHLRLWRAYEGARLEVARTILLVIGDADASDFKTVYKPWGASMGGREIEYKAIKHLNEDHYTWEMAPASLNMMSAAARREQLRDLASRAQANTTNQSARTVSNPDLEMIEQMELAGEEDIERHLEIMEEGGYEAPDTMTNLSKGMMMVTANYHRLRRYKDVKLSMPMIQNHIRWVLKAASITRGAAMAAQSMVPFQPTQGVNGTSSAQGV